MDSKAIGNDVGYIKGQNRTTDKINYLIKEDAPDRESRRIRFFI